VYDVTTCYGCSVSFAKAIAVVGGGFPQKNCFGANQSSSPLSADFCTIGADRVEAVPCSDCIGIAACTVCQKDADCALQGVPNAHCETSLQICAPN
ncbi:MAG: hypothetical protein ACHREM_30205, partial [Polyangiales bacterium]